MHIGNLRTALYAYLFARHSGGKFILRIEDTDRKRNVPKAVRVIYDSLKIAGIEYDEGPDKDGGVGPYVQSLRLNIYLKYINELLDKDSAYPCFCSKDKSQDDMKKQQGRRDICRFMTKEDAQKKVDMGIPYVVRQKIPETGSTSFVDHVFGTITISNNDLDDQILLKSDGYPTYNFANVVDDHLMQITHVIRGLEYLSSTPKYYLLYESFGWKIPEYVHLPHITKANGRKLSKREGDASFQDLLEKGYLPQAVVNYVALLGWNPGNDREFFAMDDLIKEFDIDRINKSKAGFSFEKLDWINNEHIRGLPVDQFHAYANQYYTPEIIDRFDTEKISHMIQPRIIRFTEIPDAIRFIVEVPDYDITLYAHEKSKLTLSTSRLILERIYHLLSNMQNWDNLSLQNELKTLATDLTLKIGAVMWPLRIAISGLSVTPGGATEIAEIIGKDETLRRISKALSRLSISI
jgi:glutamyl-tRNA synthetase